MAKLLHYSVGANNKAILTIETDAGRETLEICEADILSILNLQSANHLTLVVADVATRAAKDAYDAGLGASEWEAFLPTPPRS
jgi:hypothetical protein